MRVWLWHVLLCRLGRHDWTFVVRRMFGQNWIAKHCSRCHWETGATSLDHDNWDSTC